MRPPLAVLVVPFLATAVQPIPNSTNAEARRFLVGPGLEFESIGEITELPSLVPGDQIVVHWRPGAYHEKFCIAGEGGTEQQPLMLIGVPDPETGMLPVMDGINAIAPSSVEYWNGPRSLIQVGGAVNPEGMSHHVIIENMHLQNARIPYTFTHWNGLTQEYLPNAACVLISMAGMVTLRHSELENCGNAIFVGGATGTHDVLIQGNHIMGGAGPQGPNLEHSIYSECRGITFTENFFDLPRGVGHNVKDRSSGTVVSYNWIYGGNRMLDLVDSNNPDIIGDPRYRDTYVYGNVILQPSQPHLNHNMIHYGGDLGGNTENYRNGMLHLYYNTIVSWRPTLTSLLALSNNNCSADVVNNVILVTQPGEHLEISGGLRGTVRMQNNLLKPGWSPSFDGGGGGSVTAEDTVESNDPGFADPDWETSYDFELGADSLARGAARPLAPDEPAPTMEYVRHQQVRPRVALADLGAFEFGQQQDERRRLHQPWVDHALSTDIHGDERLGALDAWRRAKALRRLRGN